MLIACDHIFHNNPYWSVIFRHIFAHRHPSEPFLISVPATSPLPQFPQHQDTKKIFRIDSRNLSASLLSNPSWSQRHLPSSSISSALRFQKISSASRFQKVPRHRDSGNHKHYLFILLTDASSSTSHSNSCVFLNAVWCRFTFATIQGKFSSLLLSNFKLSSILRKVS